MRNRDLLLAVCLAFMIHVGVFSLNPSRPTISPGHVAKKRMIEISLSETPRPNPPSPKLENIPKKEAETKRVARPRSKLKPKPKSKPQPNKPEPPVEDLFMPEDVMEKDQADFQEQEAEEESKKSENVQRREEETPTAYLQNPKPRYPTIARRRGIEGVVLLRVEVLPDGTVDKIEVKRSSGYRILDQSALRTIKKWRFLPATRGGVPVRGWINVPVRFELRNKGER